MKKTDFDHLLQGIGELKSHLRGELKPVRGMTVISSDLKRIRSHQGSRPSPAFIATKVRSIRARLGLSQSQFAAMIRVSKATLQNWEQGRRKPEGPALALLLIADRAPEAVLGALHRKSA